VDDHGPVVTGADRPWRQTGGEGRGEIEDLYAVGDLVERPRLGVACGDLWNGGNVEALFVALNDDIELA